MNSQQAQLVSAQANARIVGVKLAVASGRSQNRHLPQKALMEYLLMGRVNNQGETV